MLTFISLVFIEQQYKPIDNDNHYCYLFCKSHPYSGLFYLPILLFKDIKELIQLRTIGRLFLLI